jgi:hypothetical protein
MTRRSHRRPVAVQPGQGLGLDPQGPPGEEDDVQPGIEQLEEPPTSSMSGSSPQASKKASQSRRPHSR